jgi:hypothetical protein
VEAGLSLYSGLKKDPESYIFGTTGSATNLFKKRRPKETVR